LRTLKILGIILILAFLVVSCVMSCDIGKDAVEVLSGFGGGSSGGGGATGIW